MIAQCKSLYYVRNIERNKAWLLFPSTQILLKQLSSKLFPNFHRKCQRLHNWCFHALKKILQWLCCISLGVAIWCASLISTVSNFCRITLISWTKGPWGTLRKRMGCFKTPERILSWSSFVILLLLHSFMYLTFV